MKVCRNCNIEKPLSDFYKHPNMADGHLNKCAECVKGRIRNHRSENLEKIREYDKKRANLPHRVEARANYQKTDQGKMVKKKAIESYRKRYPMKYAAHVITRNYIRDGKIEISDSCSICKSTHLVQAHHDDYTKPLEIRWLCIKCHHLWHSENKAIYE